MCIRDSIYSQGSLNPGGLRTKMELEIIKQYTPDVLGFQEFHPVSRTNGFLSGLTSLGYAEVKVTIDTSKNKKNNNYTPLFYRADLLEVEKSGYLLYDGLNDSYSKGDVYKRQFLEYVKDGMKITIHEDGTVDAE